MTLGVSNLLWERVYDDAVCAALRRAGVRTIDVAPSRYFTDPARSGQQASAVRHYWDQHGITIVALQSLLYRADQGERSTSEQPPQPRLFGAQGERERLGRILSKRIELAAALGAKVLVFGSWRNRLRGGLALNDAIAQAAALFAPLAAQAAAAGMTLAVEPIHHAYGNDFLVDHDQAAALVERVSHPGFGLVLDVACAGLAQEDLQSILIRHSELIQHIQLAEPDLLPLHDTEWHRHAGPLVAAFLADRNARGGAVPGICIEALTPDGEDPVAAVQRSIEVARRWYI